MLYKYLRHFAQESIGTNIIIFIVNSKRSAKINDFFWKTLSPDEHKLFVQAIFKLFFMISVQIQIFDSWFSCCQGWLPTAARLAERRFDPALPPRSNFRSIGFCDSSDFSSVMGISADDFADFL
jgi:hypothetical protein